MTQEQEILEEVVISKDQLSEVYKRIPVDGSTVIKKDYTPHGNVDPEIRMGIDFMTEDFERVREILIEAVEANGEYQLMTYEGTNGLRGVIQNTTEHIIYAKGQDVEAVLSLRECSKPYSSDNGRLENQPLDHGSLYLQMTGNNHRKPLPDIGDTLRFVPYSNVAGGWEDIGGVDLRTLAAFKK